MRRSSQAAVRPKQRVRVALALADQTLLQAACLAFGLLDSIAIRLQGVKLPGIGEVPVQLIQAMPYLLTLFLLAGFIGRTIAPKAAGVPYEKEH